ncbi:hypothetical protein BC830DRAFT_1177961 [Chytriomyces sp. MP71]|nr:hypothetical protein BC830DRAFT_1177961 [Chytriomyces sp. MP71]
MVDRSFSVPQCHAFDPSDNCVKILAGKDYAMGDEVFNYGPVRNTKLARLYGFVIPNNPHDAYPLVLSTSPLAPFFREKCAIFDAVGIAVNETFELTLVDPLPGRVLQYLRIQRLEWPHLNLFDVTIDK